MKIDELNNLATKLFDSLKDLSYEDVKQFVANNLSNVLSILISLIGLVVLLFIIFTGINQAKELNDQLIVLNSKIDPVQKHAKTLDDTNSYYKTIRPPLNDDKLISYLTEIANQRNISIESFDSPQIKLKSFYQETKITFNCKTQKFKDALLFIHDVERSNFLLKIDSIDISQSVGELSEKNKQNIEVSFSISITSIQLASYENKKVNKK